MGNVRLGPIILIISMMGLGLFVVVTILTGTGNVLGATYRFIWIPALLVGCIAPRASMYILAVLAGYLDIPKKFLVVGDIMYFGDVYFILAIPPIMLAGMVVHYLATYALRVRHMSRRDIILLSVATSLVGATAMVAVVKVGLDPLILKSLANTSAYYGLIFVLPLALPRVADVQKFLRFVVIIMIPAALHALWHFRFGLLDFEHRYMETGFSINLKYLLWGEGIFGPFSAQGPLATTMAICAAICLTPFFYWRRVSKEFRLMPTVVCILLFILFAAAAVLSLKRGPLLIIPGVMFGLIVLRSGVLTIGTYLVAITGLVCLVVLGEDLAYKLESWQGTLYEIFGSGGTNADLFRIRTFHSRFTDFSMLADGKNWKPFGAEIAEGEDGYRAHALVVRLLLEYGYVPVVAVLMFVVPSLFFLHRRLIRMSAGKGFEVFQLRLVSSLAFSLLGASVIGVLSMEAYPNPFFFGVFLGIMAACLTRARDEQEQSVPVLSPEHPPILGPGGVRPVSQ